MKSNSLEKLKIRFERVNRLLKDVYSQETRLSNLLTTQGEPLAQISKWQQNKDWLLNFLNGFETKLIARLTDVASEQDIKILSDCYGLNGAEEREINQVALEIGISTTQAENELSKIIAFLRTKPGREILENVARETSKIAHYVVIELDNASYIWTDNTWVESDTFIHPSEAIVRKLNSLIATRLQREDDAISDIQTMLDRAREARDTLQYSRAVKLARHVLELEKENLGAAAILSSALRANGKPQEALDETEMFKDTNYLPLLTSRAAALCDLKRWQDAKRVIGRSLAISKSEEAFSVVNRIKAERPDLYDDPAD